MSEPTKESLQPAEIIHHLEVAGHRALYVGGFVRDTLLGQRPEDADIATSADPEQIMTLFHGKAKLKQQGKQFGVVTVDGVEVAMFRGEHYVTPGKPAVCAVDDFSQDAARRDFTINALGMTAAGEVVDPVGGMADLRAGLIRAVGDPDTRFAEDPARLLRAVTFAARLGFEIHGETVTAIRRQAALTATLPKERIAKELGKMIDRRVLHQGLVLLRDLDLLIYVLPELGHLPDMNRSQPSPWQQTIQAVQAAEAMAAPRAVVWAALYHRCAEGQVPDARVARTSALHARQTVLVLQGGKPLTARVELLVRWHQLTLPHTPHQAIRILRLLSLRFPARGQLNAFLSELFMVLQATVAHCPSTARAQRLQEITRTEHMMACVMANVPLYPREAGIDGAALGLKGPHAGHIIRQMLYQAQRRSLAICGTDPE